VAERVKRVLLQAIPMQEPLELVKHLLSPGGQALVVFSV
jgi:hypothetical protein